MGFLGNLEFFFELSYKAPKTPRSSKGLHPLMALCEAGSRACISLLMLLSECMDARAASEASNTCKNGDSLLAAFLPRAKRVQPERASSERDRAPIISQLNGQSQYPQRDI